MEILKSISTSVKRLKARWLREETVRLYNQGFYSESMKVGKKALKSYEELNLSYGIGVSARNLSLLCCRVSDYENALKYGKRSLKVLKLISDKKELLRAFIYTGMAHQNLGDYDEALSNYKKTLELAKELNDLEVQGLAFSGISKVLMSLGRYTEAIEYIDYSLGMSHIGMPSEAINIGEIEDLTQKGNCYFYIGDYEIAEKYYRKALDKSQNSSDLMVKSISLSSLGLLLFNKSEYHEAILTLNKCIEVQKQISDLKGVGSNFCGQTR